MPGSASRGSVSLTVADNGRGFSDTAENGHGLKGLRERASLLRGSLAAGTGPWHWKAPLRWWGEACNGEETLRLTREHRPDVVLMDLRMPGMEGIEATRHIRRTWPDVRVLVLTTFDLEEELF